MTQTVPNERVSAPDDGAERRPFVVERTDEDGPLLRCEGLLVLEHARAIWEALDEQLAPEPPDGMRVDLSGVERTDAGTLALVLERVAEGSELRREQVVGARDEVRGTVDLLLRRGPVQPSREPERPRGTLEHVGDATVELLRGTRGALAFVGSVLIGFKRMIRRPRSVRWRELDVLCERVGADALPIVAMVSLLTGLMLAFQSAGQLVSVGAGAYVADLVIQGMTRYLGPFMTALMVTGRSGAAFAAELGTMKANQEVEALQVMALDPICFLVFPRLLALLLMVPLLTVLADGVGAMGGLIVGMTRLGMPPVAYLEQTRSAFDVVDVLFGLGKSVVFALTIGLVACQRGLATRGGADAVGRSTTSAVVITLVLLVLEDSMFSVVADQAGW